MIGDENILDMPPEIHNGVSLERLNSYALNNLNCLIENRNCDYISPSQPLHFDSSSLTVMNFNIRYVSSNFVKFKTEILTYMYDIIGLCETRLTDDTEHLYMIPNYNYYATNVSSDKGGVCIFIKNTISCKKRPDLCRITDHFESTFVECTIGGKPLIVGMCYRRPGTPVNSFQIELSNILESITCNSIIMGDINLNMLNHDHDNTVKNYINLMCEYSYVPVITKPTRVQRNSISLLDQIWISFDQVESTNSKIILTDITDHYPVLFHRKLNHTNHNKHTISFRKRGEECDNLFKTGLENSNIYDILLENDTETAFNRFNAVISELYDESYPIISKTVFLNKLKRPWITPAIIQSIKTKNKLYKKFVKKPITYRNIYISYRNHLTKVIKTAKNNFHKQQFEACSGNVKETWKNINKMLGKFHNNINKSFKINNSKVENELEIAEAFNTYYTNIGNETVRNLPQTNRSFNEYLPQYDGNDIRWHNTTEAEVKSIISKCNETQPGPDNIPIRVYKNNIDFLCPIIVHLCNLSLQTGIFPSLHKTGKVIPLYKSKERDDI